MMDYEYGFEAAQGIDPRCYSFWGWFSHCSSFSNEDLPSDYLGIISAIKNMSLEEMLEPKLLGGGKQQSSLPDEYWGNSWPLLQPVKCRFGFCSNSNPFNDQCTLKVFDLTTKRYSNRPWPSLLVVQPYGFGVYWARNISQFTNFAIAAPAPPSTLQGTPVP